MRVAHLVANPLPALHYGGTERVAYWCALEQHALNCEISLLTPRPSSVAFARCLSIPQDREAWLRLLDQNLFDLVHFHTLVPPQFPDSFPHLVTIHGNGRPGEVFSRNSVFVSRNHAQRHGSTRFVYNGLRLSDYPLRSPRPATRQALFLAKASWRIKNLKGALEISRRAQHRLLVAGGRRPLRPWGLWAWHARFFGNTNDTAKIHLIHQSDALLFPVLWHEPFGIAVIEALACGVPVVATPFGSLPELVSPSCGITSALSSEMVEYLQSHAARVSPEACRSRVEENFTSSKMARAYLDLYAEILKKGSLQETAPRTQAESSECILDPKNQTSGLR